MADWSFKARGPGSSQAAYRKDRAQQQADLPLYTDNHKYLPLFRGIPIRSTENPKAALTELPPMAFPYEVQNSIAYHAEISGLVHVDELKKLADEDGKIDVNDLPSVYIRHLKPEEGPDIQLNPGTWMPANLVSVEEQENGLVSETTLAPVELPANIEDASFAELKALESQIRAAKISKIRAAGVDAHVTSSES